MDDQELICRFEIPGIRPVPWSAPTVTRSGVAFKKKPLVAWQRLVHQYAALNIDRRRPVHEGPVRLVLHFELAPRGPKQRVPDATNLQKSLEDALQGVAYRNDTQVRSVTTDRTFGDRNHTTVEVYAL